MTVSFAAPILPLKPCICAHMCFNGMGIFGSGLSLMALTCRGTVIYEQSALQIYAQGQKEHRSCDSARTML